ncbi:hypothetical protein HZA43_02955 [Candidatus Peregrinibacteria bacterium]|nr:hypothetical protein [Candidatus Peregrinibacteria bacterium]
MDTRNTVRKAWQITQVYLKKLIWYGAVPSFFSILVSSAYLAYQYNAFQHSKLLNPEENSNILGTIQTLFDLIKQYPALSVSLVITAVIVFLCYTLLPPIFNGILIAAITRINDYQELEGVTEIGVRRFFPMFEFRLMMGSFSVITLFTESSFVLRWWGESIFFVILPFLLFVSFVGFILSILFTYSDFYIVLHNKPLIKSISGSCVLVLANLRHTLLISILVVLIGIRAILNVLLVLMIPMLIVVLTSYFATIQLAVVGIILSVIIGLSLSILAAYLLGLFHVFTTTVWVLTFKQLVEKNTSLKNEENGEDNKMASDIAAPPVEVEPRLPLDG